MKKEYKTYNQQLRKLREKGISCDEQYDKSILARSGYFNIINGYKQPFVAGNKADKTHYYIKGTQLTHIKAVKDFDTELRYFLLKYITIVEEEIRTLTGYKFDEHNNKGKEPWYELKSYNSKASISNRMKTISSIYSELSRTPLKYVHFYKDTHEMIPTWIMVKVINFGTFIQFLNCTKKDVTHAICNFYSLHDNNGLPNIKLLIGSLHWLRLVRNSCAHNERIYCIEEELRKDKHTGRIKELYIAQLPPSYSKTEQKQLFDLFIYLKYYLPNNEYNIFINELKCMLINLQQDIHPNAFNYIISKMGIKNLSDLTTLETLTKTDIPYNKFDNI